jgi:hypothetical protein
MKTFMLEVRVSRTRRVHGSVRYVTFGVSTKVARQILDTAEMKKGLGSRTRATLPMVQLEECATWLDDGYKKVRPMLLPDTPSIVTVHPDGTFALMNYFKPCVVSSERVPVERLLEVMTSTTDEEVVLMARQPELQQLALSH